MSENKKGWWQMPTLWGWILTALIVVLNFVYAVFYPHVFKSLLDNANEVGDFLAGTAGTLALVWLIVGYFLQREELHQNTKALNDQKGEFEKQVSEMKDQVIATNKMAKAMLSMAESNENLISLNKSQTMRKEREKMESVKPIFVFGGGGSTTGRGDQYKIINKGHRVHNLSIKTNNKEVNCHIGIISIFDTDQNLTFEFMVVPEFEWPIHIEISYEDTYGNNFIEKFKFVYSKKLLPIDARKLVKETSD